MATLESRNGSFRVIFRLAGRRYARSLRTKSERAALASLARLEDNLRRVELGTLELPDDADVVSFLLSDGRQPKKPVAQPRPAGPLSIGQLLDEYLALPSHSIEVSTRRVIEIHVRHLKRVLNTRQPLAQFRLADLQRYVDTRAGQQGLRGRTLSPATISKELTTSPPPGDGRLHNGYVQQAFPKSGIRLPKGAEKPRFQTRHEIQRHIDRGGFSDNEQRLLWDCLFLTGQEVADLLEYVREHAWQSFLYPMVVFAAHTGARRSEMMRSRIEDIDLDASVATIRETKRKKGTATTRRVPLSPFLHTVLTQWFADHPGGAHTFCKLTRPHASDPVSPSALTRDEAHDYLKRTLAGSCWSVLRGWHVFRHSFCSNCAAAGIDQRVINAWVGHQTEEMVRRYRHLIPNQEQAAIRQVFG